MRHTHHGLVDGTVAMRVVLAYYLADHRRALAKAGLRKQPEVGIHGVEDTPLHRLKPVADVGERAARDDAQRVVEVALLRGLVEWDRVDDLHGVAGLVLECGRRCVPVDPEASANR